jgi:hypothetical protein
MPSDRLADKLANLPTLAPPKPRMIWPDRGLFVLAAVLGFAGIMAARLNGLSGLPVAVGAVGLIGLYALIAGLAGWFATEPDRLGDNCYYLGFLFTLASLSAALIAVEQQPRALRGDLIEALIGSFGVSLLSTVAGIALRAVFLQLRPEVTATEAELERETQHLTARLRDQLAAAVLEFETFRLRTQTMLDSQLDHGSRVAGEVGRLVDRIAGVDVPPDILTAKFAALGGRLLGLVQTLEDAAEADSQRQRALARVVENLDRMVSRLSDLGSLEAVGREAALLAGTLGELRQQSAALGAIGAALGADSAAVVEAQRAIRLNLAQSGAALTQLQDGLVELVEAVTARMAP